MADWRGFRYQTGEIASIVEALKEHGVAQADIDVLDDIKVFNDGLLEYEIEPDENVPPDGLALPTKVYPEFFMRVTYKTPFGQVHIDYFLIEKEEKSYDDIFWG